MSQEIINKLLESSAKLHTIKGLQQPEEFLLENRNLEETKQELLRKVLQAEQEANDGEEKFLNLKKHRDEMEKVSSKDLEAIKNMENRRARVIQQKNEFAKTLNDSNMKFEDYQQATQILNNLQCLCDDN
ncbi:unnamed protein product [Caenorhabditis angaria]|uniref:Uncharacterized protein n=1 Tax=Caenorhabditis angaria TaxID=860376 RepID=A0A9P1I3J7_9PELO|nr:unnamed protein product [Caenorhabditis angaria]